MVEFNFEYLGTKEGLLKIFQIIIGGIAAGICFYYDYYGLFLLFLSIFWVGSCMLVLSIVCGAGMDVIYEGIYHFIGFVLILAGSIIIIIDNSDKTGFKVHDLLLTAGVVGLLDSILYLVSAIIAFKS